MNDFLSKLESFLFDILGLALPGLILLLLFFSSLVLFDIASLPNNVLKSSVFLSGLSVLNNKVHQFFAYDKQIFVTVFLILCYIIGHVIKVFSIIQYEIGVAIFDNTLNKLFNFIFKSLKSLINNSYKLFSSRNVYNTFVYKQIKIVLTPVKNIVNKIFVFKAPDYFSDNESLKTKSIELLNNRLRTQFPDKWYSLYKFSTVLNSQEHIKSIAPNFLAKYNLYRSLAFIFLLMTAFFALFFNHANDYLNPSILRIKGLIIAASIILWFTFHYKYKRYWTLCGNETLVSLFYFLNKKKVTL